MTPTLVGVGNVVVDVVLEVPALPPPGGDVLATGGGLYAGGALNVLAAAARHGMRAVYGGVLGTGPLARLAAEALAAEGVVAALDPEAGNDTGCTVAVVDAGGERTFLTRVGAEATLTAARLATLRPAPGDWVHVSGYGLAHPVNRDALTGWVPALPAGVRVVFDPGPLAGGLDRDAVAAVAGRADWISATGAEAAALTGCGDPPGAARALAARAGSGVVVRLGADGCLLVEPAGEVRHVAGFAVTAVDANGAGDTHTGAFVARLAAGAGPVDAARLANAAAAVAVTRRGPATSPTAGEVEAWVGAAG